MSDRRQANVLVFCELRTKVKLGGTYRGMYRRVLGGDLKSMYYHSNS